MSDSAPQLAYHGLNPANPLTLVGRDVVKWTAIATFLLSLLSILSMLQNTVRNWFGSFANLRRFGVALPDWVLIVAQVSPWLVAVSGLSLLLCSVGLIARGSSFRRFFVIVLVAFIVSKLMYAGSNAAIGFSVTRRMGATSPQFLMIVGTITTAVLELPLLVLALVLTTRRWIRDALSDGFAETGGFMVRFAAGVGVLSGVLGVVNNILPFLGDVLSTRIISSIGSQPHLGTGLIGFNDVWSFTSQGVMILCAVAAIIGGLLLLGLNPRGRRAVVIQARIAVIINVVTVSFIAILMRTYAETPLGDSLALQLAIRVTSLIVNTCLWIYLGSRAVTRLLEASSDDIPVAHLVKEPHAVAG